ncbi:hypothetical protein HK101_002514, partial [Irineochytrium annulatum]
MAATDSIHPTQDIIDALGSPTGEHYLVIGGCGFLGRVIVSQLLARGESHVTIFDLRQTFDDDRIRFVIGDITSKADVLNACANQTIVIHTASPPHGLGRDVFWRVNVDGTRNVIDACTAPASSVRKLVYTSSASVIYNGQDLINADESVPYCDVHMDAYNETKAKAEEMVLTAAGGRLLTAALRPSGIFGPRDMQGASTLIKTAKAGKTGVMIGNNSTLFDWTYVENVAYAHVLAADRLEGGNGTSGKAYNITNDNPIFFWDFVKLIWALLGHHQTLRYSIPLPIAYMMAYLVEAVCFILKPVLGEFHPTFTVFRIRIFASNRFFD